METTITLNTEICRICEETNYLINLFDESNLHLYEKLKEIEDFGENDLFDSMFKYICTSCENTLEGFYEFKIQCRNTRSKLVSAATCGIFVQPQETLIILDDIPDAQEDVVIDDDTESESSVELIQFSESINAQGISNQQMESNVHANNQKSEMKIISVSGSDGSVIEPNHPKSILCTICNKKIITKNYEMHKVRHEQKKIFECTECSQTFMSKKYWIAHLKDHINFREYQCDQCDKAFMVADHLKAHKATHSDDKSFVCSTCNRGFTRYRNLKAHMLKVHGKDISAEGNS
ncbi:zinc finger protein 432-like [Lutzomyia longipalpis]|uniref:C2h2-type zn-finger protein n=1 Tax=Lutzomyia longipalpis TaxID=7200 RepID=A0A1B0CG56_LUTLO|nr:zinc finger protein 432-like [Lutzomyia longipalpis]